MTDWQTVGHVGVDSARLLITDPRHLDSEWGHGSYSDDGITAALFARDDCAAQLQYARGHDGVGVALFPGHGDGIYPVQVTYTDTGHVAAVRVVFIPDAFTD
jgi:hypothetical protein